jgi:uncharacterized protein YggE
VRELPKVRLFRCILITATAALSLALLALPDASPAAERPAASVIEVSAESRIEVPADLALLDFGVVTRAASAAAAAQENSARMERLTAALRKTLGSDGVLRTGAYSIRPVYAPSREQNAPQITGYEAVNSVHVTIKTMTRVGSTIDAAVEAGANQVQRLAFTLADDREPRRRALAAAAVDAREKAQTLATALGVQLMGVRSVVEQDLGGPRPLERQVGFQAQPAAVTPIEAGNVELRARVVLTMELTPAAR